MTREHLTIRSEEAISAKSDGHFSPMWHRWARDEKHRIEAAMFSMAAHVSRTDDPGMHWMSAVPAMPRFPPIETELPDNTSTPVAGITGIQPYVRLQHVLLRTNPDEADSHCDLGHLLKYSISIVVDNPTGRA
jgi:hypothetical protein